MAILRLSGKAFASPLEFPRKCSTACSFNNNRESLESIIAGNNGIVSNNSTVQSNDMVNNNGNGESVTQQPNVDTISNVSTPTGKIYNLHVFKYKNW
jgi:hypothetical protein